MKRYNNNDYILTLDSEVKLLSVVFTIHAIQSINKKRIHKYTKHYSKIDRCYH